LLLISTLFPYTTLFRSDFIAGNLARIGVDSKRIVLFRDENGREGVEYPTPVGNIDILGTDDEGTLYVFELKLSRGPDRAVGQLRSEEHTSELQSREKLV